MFEESIPRECRRTHEQLAGTLDGFACVADATYVPDDPGGETVEVTLAPWSKGLPPVLTRVAEQFDARVRRMEPRGQDLPDRVLIR